MASYVSGVALENFKESERFARLGLVANPAEPVLLNNLAYALVNLDRLTEAERILSAMRPRSQAEETVQLATTGLLNYRKGNLEMGRSLYRQAMDKAERAKLAKLRARAAVFFALEEVRAHSPTADDARTLAVRLTRNYLDADFATLIQKVNAARP